MSAGARATPEQLARLQPLAALSPERLNELAEVVVVERAPRGSDPLKGRMTQSIFILTGEILLAYDGGGTLVVVGGSEESHQALNRQARGLSRSKAITDVDLIVIDDDVLDILSTWDQMAGGVQGDASVMGQAMRSDGRLVTGAFSLTTLRSGAFAQLPPAHIEELMKRFERAKTERGQVIIREGDEGDYYYVVETGRFQVERLVGGAKVVLAELKGGDAFGEEALVSEAKRNATVVSLGEGVLLRLSRHDFDQLLREPLLRRLPFSEAAERVRQGALWLDVRYPSEYQYDKLPGAINVPLAEVRNMFAVLDRNKEYVAYCQSGRRSAAATFLFAQRGFKVWLLDGGLKSAERAG